MIGTCYATFAEKREVFPREVIPALFAMALEAAAVSEQLTSWLSEGALLQYEKGAAQLRALHELARSGRYRKASQPCDLLQPVAVTLAQGAPCSGWAMVLGAALQALDYPWRVGTAGDDTDPFRHVFVQAWHAGRWFTLDCKGSQRGQEFDYNAAAHQYPDLRYWERS